MNSINIKTGYHPGAIGRIAELHARYYSLHWNFGVFFEAKVASELSEFTVRFDKRCDGFWTAWERERVEGSIIIDSIKADSEGAHLRWYIISEKLHGQGIGEQLLSLAMQHCQMLNFPSVYLWTFAGLDAARHLYAKHGFRLDQEQHGKQWGTPVIEQKFVCLL
jgi:GNAT superfamily N-acetyltransferase